MRNIVVDTGAVVALLRPRDALHLAAVAAFEALRPNDRLSTTWPVITECAFILRDIDTAFWDWLAHAAIDIAEFSLQEALEMRIWARRYRGREVDFADSSLAWLADRLRTRTILTTDFRDFSTYRLRGGKSFELLIAPR